MRQVIPPLAVVCAALFLSACNRPSAPVRPNAYKMGDKVSVGHIIYTVIDTEWKTSLTEDPDSRSPQYRFLLVRMSAVNGGGDNVMLPNPVIEDDAGNTYQEVSEGKGVPEWAGYLRRIAPAEASIGNILFDAPPKSYRLRVTDENGEKPTLIDLPLSFN